MLKVMTLQTFGLVLGVFLVFSSNLNAQLGAASEDFVVKILPQFPAPFSEVRAEANSFTFDINRAQIQWILNGKILAQGIGAKEATFTARGLGALDTLRVVVSPQEGSALEKSFEIRPSAVDLLIETNSFVPEWYKGASLLTPGGELKVVAIPHFVSQGARLKPETLNYAWKVGGRVRGDLSGRGRQTISIKTNPIQNGRIPVSVTVSSPQETIQSEASLAVETHTPTILFYERSPLEGVRFFSALSQKVIPAGENIEVEAVPFFMSTASMKDVKFSWKFNNQKVEADPDEPHRFIVTSSEGTKGNATLELVVNGIKNVFEEARSSVTIYVE